MNDATGRLLAQAPIKRGFFHIKSAKILQHRAEPLRRLQENSGHNPGSVQQVRTGHF